MHTTQTSSSLSVKERHKTGRTGFCSHEDVMFRNFFLKMNWPSLASIIGGIVYKRKADGMKIHKTEIKDKVFSIVLQKMINGE